MATTSIGWGDGTTGRIFVTFTGSVGSSQMAVSSDPNKTLTNREKRITFKSTAGLVLGTLLISQKPRARSYSLSYKPAYK